MSSPSPRNLLTRPLLVLVAVVLLGPLLFASARSADAQNLSVEQINDDLGVGINLGNALEGPREGDWGLTLEADWFSEIAEAGFGHVRVPIRFSAYAGQNAPYTIPTGNDSSVRNARNLWERIDWVIENAEANDLYVIIDVHLYEELFENLATERPRFLAIWEQISQRYADAGPRVLFEVLNEPRGPFNDDPALLNDLYADALSIIRRTNPTRPVLIGPAFWNQIGGLDALELPNNDRNLIVSLHFYDPFEFTHQGATWLDEVPPAPANFDTDTMAFGHGWRDWSWDLSHRSTGSSLIVDFDKQWAGLGFSRWPSTVSPASLKIVAQGRAELSVRCRTAAIEDDELTRITTTSQRQTFTIDMRACPNQTQSIALMLAVPSTSADPVTFTEIELCETSGLCTDLIETGAEAIDSAFARAAFWAQANNRPINVGEFGAYSAGGRSDLNQRAEWTELVRRAGERNGFSMSYWEFGAGFGAYDLSSGEWTAPLLNALGVQPPPPKSDPGSFTCLGERVTVHLDINPNAVTNGRDVILGTAGADIIYGLGGSDVICSGGGNDVVFGGSGHDVIHAGSGADTVYGGIGDDTITGGFGDDMLNGSSGNDEVSGGSGQDVITGGYGADRLSGNYGADRIFGQGGVDTLIGGPNNDYLHGGDNTDRIYGGRGDDDLRGGAASDWLFGQSGNDKLRGDLDADLATNGGGGFDRCQPDPLGRPPARCESELS